MSPQKRIKDLPLDDQNYQSVEYDDFFLTEKNKKVKSKDLGKKSAQINSYFFEYLKGYNIPCAYVKRSGDHLIFLKFNEIPFRIKILNSADKRTAKIFSLKPGSALELPIFEYHYGESKDSLITESHLISFDLCSYDELKFINRICSKINAIIKSFFERRNESFVELTCGFGKFDNKIFLIDGFSPLSLKIVKSSTDSKLPDPYKIETHFQMKKYTDFLLHLTNGE